MATVSFEKDIVIRNKKSAKKIKKSLKVKEVKDLPTTIKNISESQAKASLLVEKYFSV